MSAQREPPGEARPDIERVRRALARMSRSAVTPDGPLAAVALVLAGRTDDLHICLIRRAEHEHDRWSGHIALPGGRVDDEDRSAQAAAIRETWEEVGLRLDDAPCLGMLPTQPVRSAGRIIGMSLSPFVFHLGATLARLTPTDGEVAEAFWVPLRHLLDPTNAVLRPTPRDGEILQLPAILYQGHYIWGLTYRVLEAFFGAMDLHIADPERRRL